MANATLSTPQTVKTGTFSVMLSIDRVTGVDKTDFNMHALSGNGIKDVDFEIAGDEPNTTFNLMFTVPTEAVGSFELSMTGMVTPADGSQSAEPEPVVSNTLLIVYDTTVAVKMTFGEVEYRENGEIVVPATFDEDVIILSKAVFTLFTVSGDTLAGVDYFVRGEKTDYEIVFQTGSGHKGSFKVKPTGRVLKVSTGVWDDVVVIAPKLVPFGY